MLCALACFIFILATITTINAGAARSETPANSTAREYWTNSLGMVFTPVAGTRTRFSIYETRVKDFEPFAKKPGGQGDKENSLTSGGLVSHPPRKTWRTPGFVQGHDHPVVFVSWEDAAAFCEWLTLQEQKSGVLKGRERYRLPTDREWSAAAGGALYPWLDSPLAQNPSQAAQAADSTKILDERRYFPPPKGAGNYAGAEARAAQGPDFPTLRRYDDGFPFTAPIGSFWPNHAGLYDMGGNVWEWCEDWFHRDLIPKRLETKIPFNNPDGGGRTFKVLRGASWLDSNPAILFTDLRFFEFPDHRSDQIGFRVVLAEGDASK